MAGIYIHIPFCKKACHYCDFHFSTSLQQKPQLLSALIKEIDLSAASAFIDGTERCETIYFGGGTPSLLDTNDLSQVFDALQRNFLISSNAEITLEANPDDITGEKLKQWQQFGINRLSVGIQSFQEAELKWMNRAHGAMDAVRCIDLVNDAGFLNYSVDLIYGSPLLSNADWEYNVNTVIEKKIPHLSCYALTVEPSTALAKMIEQHKRPPVDPARQAEQFLLLTNWLGEAGYEHYEISNFALPGRLSQHNSSYWQGKHYYGFGPSAHAFNGTTRRWNIANNTAYIRSLAEDKLPYEEEVLTTTQQLNEYIMTSLRTAVGLDLEQVASRFGENYAAEITAAAGRFIGIGHLRQQDNKIILSRDGKLYADGIAADLFFE